MFVFIIFLCLTAAYAGPATENYKDQFCTDPRTMRKHAAYTEWADAYSCSRHRCQPGGRNLAIYTVGCKRVEAPESAIECEEVVEDTNMQFPYCCTRLRCLVVVRGEVWTRVLGQPWETLPAAPWSHMYKMKKPPPADGTFLPKSPGEGPIYELQTETGNNEADKVLRAKGPATEAADCNDVAPRANAAPDIVIALSTNSDLKPSKKNDGARHKRGRKTVPNQNQFLEDDVLEPHLEEPEEPSTEKATPPEPASDERYYANAYGVTQKIPAKMALQREHHQPQVSWTEIPQSQWNEHEAPSEPEAAPREHAYHQPEYPTVEAEKKEEKPGLQALVDAIGTRMRDIETVVQRMSEKVKPPAANDAEFPDSTEKRSQLDPEIQPHKHHSSKERKEDRMKKPNPDGEHYKRFSKHVSKYVHSATDITTEPPLFVEDSKLNGYFSDASNTMVRRSGNPPKEPAATYMAPVENRRKAPAHISVVSDASEEVEKKHKKHTHKRKRVKGSHHKKHHAKDDKRKRFNRLNSMELDRNTVSVEDSSAGAASN